MKRYILPLLVLLLASTSSWGRSIELDMHNKALGFNYMNSDSILIKGMGVEAGFLMRESQKTLFHAGLSVAGKNLSEQGSFDISLGGRFYNLSESGSSFNAIALGGKVRFSPMMRVGLSGHLYFSPDITTFGDSNGLTDFMLRADYQLIPQAFAYIGHRHINVKLPGSDSRLDNDLHIGFKLLF
jgi:hypothetical protein